MDESFRWLIANRKYKQALTIVNKAIRINKADESLVMDKFRLLVNSKQLSNLMESKPRGITLNKNDKERELTQALYQPENEPNLNIEMVKEIENEATVHKYTLLDLLKKKRIAVNVFIFWFLW